MSTFSCATIGFPRIGSKRQMKTCLESYWKGGLTEAQLRTTARQVEEEAWGAQRDAGIQRVAVDGTWYDSVLDMTFALGLIPKRFKATGLTGTDLYFALARGADGCTALDMSKHFDSNYHSLVPELEADFEPQPNFELLLERVAAGQQTLGKAAAIPLFVGPLTLVLLARLAPGLAAEVALQRVLPAYRQLLRQVHALGATEVQLHEPCLATDAGGAALPLLREAYANLAGEGCAIDLVVPYADVSAAVLKTAVGLPLAALSLDFVGVPGAATPNRTAQLLVELAEAGGWPAHLRLGAGVIDGRSVWRDDTDAVLAVLARLSAAGIRHISVQSSVSLQHLPWDTEAEPETPSLAAKPDATAAAAGRPALARGLPAEIRARLAFAKQKLQLLVQVAAQAGTAPAAGAAPGAALSGKASEAGVEAIPADWFRRSEPFAVRRPKQLQFHALPTTSIGSFPQTAEVRRARALLAKGQLTPLEYQARMDAFITHCIGVQEGLDIDVLVHGEAERTDMVEFFGEQLEGLLFTANAWVQSYGSRYVRPPIIHGDVAWRGPMTVREWRVAQDAACTGRPVKGMLTGPVTILNWSFPRKDVTRRVQALQLALALRREVDALQQAGCKVVQVDEPALREGLPLKKEHWDSYLSWAVDAFRLSTTVARPDVQVVTHLCYSNFEDILQAVDDMDADVLTIENSRSGDEMVRALSKAGYHRDLSPGVYDVHSPVVPPVDWFVDKISSYVATCPQFKDCPDRLVIAPDCGLKTRGWAEVIPALRNMVQAARIMRERIGKGAAEQGHAPTGSQHVHAGNGACCRDR